MEAMTASLRQQFSSLTDALHRVDDNWTNFGAVIVMLNSVLFQVLRNLLRSPETRTHVLKWVVNCMRDNAGRKQVLDCESESVGCACATKRTMSLLSLDR